MDTHITVQEELLRLLRAGVLGLCCGVLFDVLRFLRAVLPHGNTAIFLEDALFAFLFCFVLQVDAWSFCGGALRWPQAFGMLLGLLCYLLTAGLVTGRMLRRMRLFRARCLLFLIRLIRRITGKIENISENP